MVKYSQCEANALFEQSLSCPLSILGKEFLADLIGDK